MFDMKPLVEQDIDIFENPTEHSSSIYKGNNFSSVTTALLTIIIFIVSIILCGIKRKEKGIPHIYSILAPFYYLYRLKKVGVKLNEELAEKYGNFFKLSTPFLKLYFVADPKVAQKILSSHDYRLLRKPYYANFLFKASGVDNGLVALDNLQVWASHRKFLNHTVSYKSLCGYMVTYNKYRMQMEEELQRELGTSNSIEGHKVEEIVTLFNIRSISNVVLGTDLATDDENQKFRDDFRYTKDMATYRCYHPWLLSEFLWSLHPESKKLSKSQKDIRRFILDLVHKLKDLKANESKEKNSKETEEELEMGLRQFKPMLEDMLEAGFDEEEICNEVLTFFIGGHETTSSQIKFLMFFLALNPEEMRKCQGEIDSFFESSEITTTSLSLENLGYFKHLERCIFESLRLIPTIPIILRHLETPVKVDDSLTLEAGSDVLFSMWSLHRNKEVHSDPFSFDPDRFAPERSKNRSVYAFLAFSAGLRNCIGWKVAMMQMKVVMIGILQHFDILTYDKFEDIKLLHDLTVHPEKEIDLRLHRRQK